MLVQVQCVDVVANVTLSPGPKGKGVQIAMDMQLTLQFIHIELVVWVVCCRKWYSRSTPSEWRTNLRRSWASELVTAWVVIASQQQASLVFCSVLYIRQPIYGLNKPNRLLSSFSYFFFILIERWVSKQLSAYLFIGWD